MIVFNELLKPATVRNVAAIETTINNTAEPFSRFVKLTLEKIIKLRQLTRLVQPTQQLALHQDS
jgi:hypothetical protein